MDTRKGTEETRAARKSAGILIAKQRAVLDPEYLLRLAPQITFFDLVPSVLVLVLQLLGHPPASVRIG